MKQTFKQDKGVAGLTILLSLVVMLFIIGLIVMIFTLMSSELQTVTYTVTTVSVSNETVTNINTTGVSLISGAGLRDRVCNSLITVYNYSNTRIVLANITKTGCVLTNATQDLTFYGTKFNVTYSYTYNADNTATTVMNDTTGSISSVTDWFDIFVVIGAMVVLILLTVVIITAIRSSGMVAGAGSTQGANTVGTA